MHGRSLFAAVLVVLMGAMPSAGVVCDALCAAPVAPPPSSSASHCGDDTAGAVAPLPDAGLHLGSVRHGGCSHLHPAVLAPSAPASAKSLLGVGAPGTVYASMSVTVPSVSSIPHGWRLPIGESSPAPVAFPLRI